MIHTVGPRWRGGSKGEPDLLANAYRNSLQLAVDHDIRKIAFPSISTGVYHYPLDQAAAIAVKTVRDFCTENPGKIDTVRFVLFDDGTLRTYDHAIFESEQAKA